MLFKMRISKEKDLVFSLLPYTLLVLFYMVLGLDDSGNSVTTFFLYIWMGFKVESYSLLSNIDYMLFSLLFILLYIALIVLKMWKYKFFYVWLGFVSTTSAILFLPNCCPGFREWIKAN